MGAPSRSSRSARWDAAAATAPAADRHREADPDEEALTARIGQRGDDAHHLALSVEQWPTGAPGVYRGVELDQAAEVATAVLPLDRPVEARHDARRHRVGEAQRVADRERVVADLHATAEHRGHDDARR